MLKGLTNTIKNACNDIELTLSEYIVMNGQTIPIKAELNDDCYDNGNFVGTFILKELKFEASNEISYRNKEFEYYKRINGESIKIGTFITTEINNSDSEEVTKVVAMDYGLKTQVEYKSNLDYSSGNITLLDVWNECCELSGLESGVTKFTNSDFIVTDDQFTGTGATIRDVFIGIGLSSGSFIKVMNDDKIYPIFNEYDSDIKSGNNINLENDINNNPIDITIDGKSEQNGTPTPDEPVEIKSVSGVENLFDKNNINSLKGYLHGNNEITISGNDTQNKMLYISCEPSTTYTISKGMISNIFRVGSSKTIPIASTTTITQVINKPAEKNITITTGAEDNYLIIYYFNTNTTTTATEEEIINSLMVEKSAMINDYVPFGTWLKMKNTGKNLFDKDNVEKNYRLDSNGLPMASNGFSLSDYIEVKPNTIYIISRNIISGYYNNISEYNSDETHLLRNYTNSTTFSITTQNTTKYLRISDATENLNIIQLEKGTEATPYEPYQEQSMLIDMNKYDSEGNITDYYELSSIGNIKDELNIDKDGNVSITQNIGEVVLDGSESSWTMRNVTDGYIFQLPVNNIKLLPSSASQGTLLCDYFPTSTPDNLWGMNESGITNLNDASYIRIRFKDNPYTTLNDFKTWLSTHPTTVKYLLAEPQTINLGKITPLKLLEETNNITTNDELQPNMKIEYSVINEIVGEYTELEDKRDTQPITCLRLGLSQIEGENVDIQDEDLIKKYGEHWLIINDNPFAYTQAKRVDLINAIFDKVKGFGYSAFVSKTSFKPYLTCGDVIKFRNKAGKLVKSIVLRYNHNFDEITLEAPSETSATVNYVYPTKDIDLIKRTEIIVDKNTNQITSLTQQTTTIQDNLQQNYYDKTQTNQLIQTSGEGITNTFSEAGGNNIFRNTGLWFEDSSTSYYIYPKNDLYPSNTTFTNGQRAYEYWDGLVLKEYYDKAANLTSLLLQNGYFEQKQQVPNGNYTVSFKYKKLIESATTKVIINNVEYNLNKLQDTEFRTGEQDSDGNYITQPLEVTDGYIFVRFYTNVNNSTIIYDLMVNAGSVKLAYSQNQNETTTDTVNISKGITITSSNTDTIFKANSDGIRTLNKNNEVLSEFTDKGMKNKQMEVTDEATIVQVLWQNVGDQTWLTRL